MSKRADGADQCAALMRLSEAEIDDELRALGIDPETAAQKGASAVADARVRCGSYTCGMCGKNTPHQHAPEEVVIFRNGIKRGAQGVASVDGADSMGKLISALEFVIHHSDSLTPSDIQRMQAILAEVGDKQ